MTTPIFILSGLLAVAAFAAPAAGPQTGDVYREYRQIMRGRKDVEHLQERHVLADVRNFVADHPPRSVLAVLPPERSALRRTLDAPRGRGAAVWFKTAVGRDVRLKCLGNWPDVTRQCRGGPHFRADFRVMDILETLRRREGKTLEFKLDLSSPNREKLLTSAVRAIALLSPSRPTPFAS